MQIGNFLTLSRWLLHYEHRYVFCLRVYDADNDDIIEIRKQFIWTKFWYSDKSDKTLHYKFTEIPVDDISPTSSYE